MGKKAVMVCMVKVSHTGGFAIKKKYNFTSAVFEILIKFLIAKVLLNRPVRLVEEICVVN